MKAVSERFSSCAMCCMVSSLKGSSRKQTPAGFPLNGLSVNESMMNVRIFHLAWRSPAFEEGLSAQEQQPRHTQQHPRASSETKALAIEEGPDGQQNKCNHSVAGERSNVQLQTGAITDEVA